MLTAWIFYNTIITKKWRNKVANEAECWKLGVFYFNPTDKRLFLPKRSGLGITINFAHPAGILITLGLIGVIYLIGYLSKG